MDDFEPARDAGLIDRLAAGFGRVLAGAEREALAGFVAAVARWNRKLDLTAARGPQAQCEVLLGDAFVLADPELCPSGARVLDVGTGAGAPLVPLLLLRSDLRALAVEARAKRATFLRVVAVQLALGDRLRVLERKLRPERPAAPQLAGEGGFDLACSRATFAPQVWLPLGLSLAPRVLALSADAAPPPPAGARLIAERGYRLPFSGAPRRVALYLRG